jgi:hypothetical protein
MIDVNALRREVSQRRAVNTNSSFGVIPSSIPFLTDHLQNAVDSETRHLLFALILSECGRAENKPLEIHFLRRQVEELPMQPILLTSLATALAASRETAQEALQLCRAAVDLAVKENRQLRYSLSAMARVAIEVDDYQLLSYAISSLVDDAEKFRAEDIAYEFDFLESIDLNRISPDLLVRYSKLRSKNS